MLFMIAITIEAYYIILIILCDADKIEYYQSTNYYIKYDYVCNVF